MPKKTVITRAEYDQLRKQLERAKDRLREAEEQKAEAHRSAGDPDMHENAAAEEAYERLRMWSSEVSRLRSIMSKAEVTDDVPDSFETVQIGCVVVIELDRSEETYRAVMSGPQGRFSEGQIASISRLGKAILGHKAGFETDFPGNEGTTHVKILEITGAETVKEKSHRS